MDIGSKMAKCVYLWKQSYGQHTWAPEKMQSFSMVDFYFSRLRKSLSEVLII